MKRSAREYLLHIRDEAEFLRRTSVWDVITEKAPALMREIEQILTDEDL